MEHNVKLVAGPDDVIDNKKIIQEWMVEENNRMREENILQTAREEGEEIGLVKGEEIGLAKGKEKNRLDVIQKMLLEGIDYNLISKVTGKSTIQVKEIEKSLVGR